MKKVGDWMKPETLVASVMRRINKTDSCWLWTGAKLSTGYGKATLPHGSKGQVRYTGAHRLVYELLVEPIASEMTLHHTCNTPLCVNPAHLQPITRRAHASISQARRRALMLRDAYERVMTRYAARMEVA